MSLLLLCLAQDAMARERKDGCLAWAQENRVQRSRELDYASALQAVQQTALAWGLTSSFLMLEEGLYAHGMRNESALWSRMGVRASFMALLMAFSWRFLLIIFVSERARGMNWAVAWGTALTPLDLAPCQKQARALNGNVQPLQLKGQLVAHPVGYTALRDGIFTHPTLAEGLNALFLMLDS